MRSLVLSLILGLGALGLSLGTPTQVRAEEHRNPAFGNSAGVTQVAWHRGWYGRSHYYGGWGGYPYGGWYGGYRGYYPGYYGGWGGYPYGGWGGYAPYSNFYYRPGFFW